MERTCAGLPREELTAIQEAVGTQALAGAPAHVTEAPSGDHRVKTLCIEGWRGVNHSIAMVNQNQILEMLKRPGWRIFHRDAPYFRPHWNRAQFASGFAPEEQARIDALADPGGATMDACLRIASPVRLGQPGQARKTCTYMVTELGPTAAGFDPPTLRPAQITQGDDLVVTPSRWARDRLLDWGLSADKVHVVPHGYKTDVFAPMSPEERAEARRMVGVAPHEIVFSNVGVATWNKGVDLLLLAFAQLRSRGLPVRLFLKDHKALYGVGVGDLYAQLARSVTLLDDDAVRGAICVLSGSLSLPQLRSLYALSDAYVSPYRAEGFNLPVLEAMGCGTHVIVSAGGATDDFVPEPLAYRLHTRRGTAQDQPAVHGEFLVPDLDDLIQAMEQVARGMRPDPDRRQAALQDLAQSYSWAAVTHRLMALL
jgi:glycosyltransferase involved in cell wall biosynthesis